MNIIKIGNKDCMINNSTRYVPNEILGKYMVQLGTHANAKNEYRAEKAKVKKEGVVVGKREIKKLAAQRLFERAVRGVEYQENKLKICNALSFFSHCIAVGVGCLAYFSIHVDADDSVKSTAIVGLKLAMSALIACLINIVMQLSWLIIAIVVAFVENVAGIVEKPVRNNNQDLAKVKVL